MLIEVNPSLSVDPNLRGFGHRVALAGFWRGLAGMGAGECPTYAPYINSYGNCTNVAPSGQQSAGGSGGSGGANIVNSNYLAYNDPSSPYYQRLEYLPAGWVANPWTGVAQQQTIQSDYGAAETDRAQADAEGAAAMAAGRAKGVNVVCRTVQNDGTPGFPGLYWSSCSVAGSSEQHDAGLLAAAGGIESALMSEGRAAGTPYTSVPVLYTGPGYTAPPPPSPTANPTANPTTQQQTAATQTGKPNQSVPPRDTSVPMANNVPFTGQLLEAASGGVRQISEATGFDNQTLLLIAAGAAAYFLFMRK